MIARSPAAKPHPPDTPRGRTELAPHRVRAFAHRRLFLGMLVAVGGAALAATPWVCAAERALDYETLAGDLFDTPVRPVRVLLSRGTRALRVTCPVRCDVSCDGIRLAPEPDGRRATVTIEPQPIGGFRLSSEDPMLDGAAGQEVVIDPPPGKPLRIEWREETGEWSSPATYPGLLRLLADAASTDLAAVNEVDIERYVASVVAHEAWPTFHDAALASQAVIARTFLLDQMLRRRDDPWDVTASQQSQVYGGVRPDAVGRRALRAAVETRGLVLTWFDGRRDRIFPAYYSSACGGRTQSAAIFGPESDIPPLAGGVTCDYCAVAPEGVYRWPPRVVSLEELFQRMVARYPDLASMLAIQDVAVIQRESGGRPTRLRILGASGLSRELSAENFRFALGSRTMPSTACDIIMTPDGLRIENGCGSGHGLGLCQWGMEGQAREGRAASEILAFYYPGSRLTRVY